VMLDVTGDMVLTGSDVFSSLFIDRTGALSLEHDELRSIISQLAKAINVQHEKVQTLQTEVDEIHGNLHALSEEANSLRTRTHECEDTGREFAVKVSELRREIKAVADATGRELQDMSLYAKKEELVPLEERCGELALQIERHEEVHMETATLLSERVQACEDSITRYDDFINNDLGVRFEKIDDGLLAHKMDLEGLQITATEINTRKASRTELAELQKRVDAVAEIQTRDSATLEEAHSNLENLHECINMANDNKAQTQALWKIFREESQEVRDWASRGFSELRAATRIKMDEATALNCLDDLRAELRNNTMHLAEASARVECGIRNKAEAGDLIRLEDAVHQVRVAGAGGSGCFEARDTRDHSPGSHALTPMAAATSHGRQGLLAAHQTGMESGAPPPERAPPRVQPPLVRLTPRRPRTEPEQRYGSLAPSTLRETLSSGGQRRRRRRMQIAGSEEDGLVDTAGGQ